MRLELMEDFESLCAGTIFTSYSYCADRDLYEVIFRSMWGSYHGKIPAQYIKEIE